MLCPSCGRDNSSGAQFCDKCGSRLDSPRNNLSASSGKSDPSMVQAGFQSQPGQIAASGGTFVGCQREMGELTAAMDDALFGRGRLVMLSGEPGIGKTRTAQELASYACQQGAQVLWGRCYEEEGAPPYWPWVQSIRSYLQQADSEQLTSEMGPGAADIAEIVSTIREKQPDLEPPPTLEPEQARFRLFDSITSFWKNTARSQPTVLILDDLHWADRSSLLLLEFLVQEIETSPLLLLGTYRDLQVSRRHPLSQTLGSLIRDPRYLRVQLLGLAQQEVEQFIQTASGVNPFPGLAETIHRRTDGNPLFVGEVIRMLAQQGIEGSQARLTSIPEGVRDAIGRRLIRLSQGCNQVLTTASVIGREFDFQLLKTLSDGVAEEQLLQLVDEGLEAHMIEELPGGGERYQFSHALVQETLSEELSTSRKVRLHARIGEILEELHGDDGMTHAAELAYHFGEAEPVLGTEKLVHYSLLAGEQALGTFAWEEALTYFSRGLAAKEREPMDAERAALLFGLGRAQAATLESRRFGEALASLGRAFDYYAEVGDVERAVAIAQSPTLPFTLFRSSPEAAQLLARAFALVPPDSHEAGSLLTRYVGALGLLEADYSRAMEASSQSLAIARRAQDTTLEIATMAQAAQVDRFHLHPRRGLEKSLRAIELASLVDDPYAEIQVRGVAAGCSLVVGDLEGARVHAAAMLSLAERLGQRQESARAFWWNAEVSRLAGDWQSAYEHSERGLEAAPRDPRLLGTRAVLEGEMGKIGKSEDHLDQLLETWRLGGAAPSGYAASFPAAVIPVVNRINGVAHRSDAAQEAAEALLSSPAVVPLQALIANTGLALMAVQRGDILAAAEQYAALEPQGNKMLPGWITNADHLLALLSQTMGNPRPGWVPF